jgi:hypothetical protein
MARWPDIQRLAVAYLTSALGVRVATRTPAELETNMPMIRVRRGPGADDGITDSPLLDVEAFAATEQAAWELAEDARQAVHELDGKAVDGALVDDVTTATAPVAVDWGSPAVHRFVASYRLNLRRTYS